MDLLLGFFLSILALVFYYYRIFVAVHPTLYTRNLKMRHFLTKLPILSERYFPGLFWHGTPQTALINVMRIGVVDPCTFKPHILRLSDGGQLGLFVLNASKGEGPVVLFLPGITGCLEDTYVRTFAKAIQSTGATTIVFQNRGFGGVPLTTPKTHNSRHTEDVREAISYIRSSYPNKVLLAIGASFGGLCLGHYMLDHPDEAAKGLKSVLMISAVWHHYNALHNSESSFMNRIFAQVMTRSLLRTAQSMKEILETREDLFDWEMIQRSKNMRDVERSLNVVQYGYSSLHDYLTDAVLQGKAHFPLPVYALHARDDPFIPVTDLPVEEAMTEGSNLALIVTSRGGHVGFLEGIVPKESHYLERFITQYIDAWPKHTDRF